MVSPPADSGRNQLSALWSRESLSRLALSLILAVGLWVYITGKQLPGSADFPQPIPVTIASLGRALTVTNNLPPVYVRYQTDSGSTYVSPTSFQASVNLANSGPGTHSNVPVDVLSTDPGIKVLSWTPKSVPVVVERQVTKQVPVAAHYVFRSPATGYDAGPPEFDPSYILVSGPDSVVSQVTQAVVQLDLRGARSSILSLYTPVPRTTSGSVVSGSTHLSLNPSVVQVKVAIRAVASFKTVPILVQPRGVPAAGYGVHAIAENPSAVTITGLPSVLSRISTLKTAPISVAHRTGGAVHVRARLLIPRGVTASTRTVAVEIQLTPIEASSQTNIAVTPINVTPGLLVSVRQATVLVTVVGSSSALAHAASNLSATVNLYGYGPGYYQLTPRVTGANGVQVESVFPATVNVSLVTAR